MPSTMINYYPYGDATIFEYFGYAMSKGEKLYIDIFDHKGPIIFFINYLGYKLYGSVGIKIIYLLTIFIFLIYTYKIVKLFSDKEQVAYITMLIASIIFLTVYQSGLGLEGYMLPLITYSLYIYLYYFLNNNISYLKIIITGICFSLVFFTKMNMVGLWIILSLITIIKQISEKKIKNLLKFTTNFLIGVLIITIPITIYFIVNNSLYEMIYQSFIINIAYSGDSPIGKYQVISWLISVLNSYMIPIIVVLVSIIYYKKNKNLAIGGIILLTFCTFASIISKREYLHYLIVLIPLFIPYIAIFIDYILKNINIKVKSVLILFTILIIYFPHIKNIKEQVAVRNQDNATDVRNAANYIKSKTNEKDRIYGHRMYGSVYLLSDRLSSTRYFFVPGFYDEKIFYDDYVKHFEKNYPTYILIEHGKYAGFDLKTDKYIDNIIKSKYKYEKNFNNITLYKKN